MRRHALSYRDEETVWFILDLVCSGEVGWPELVEALRHPRAVTARVAEKTLNNILHEMISFGYLYRTGEVAGRGRADSRVVKVTEVGRLALLRRDGEVLGWPDPWAPPVEDEGGYADSLEELLT